MGTQRKNGGMSNFLTDIMHATYFYKMYRKELLQKYFSILFGSNFLGQGRVCGIGDYCTKRIKLLNMQNGLSLCSISAVSALRGGGRRAGIRCQSQISAFILCIMINDLSAGS